MTVMTINGRTGNLNLFTELRPIVACLTVGVGSRQKRDTHARTKKEKDQQQNLALILLSLVGSKETHSQVLSKSDRVCTHQRNISAVAQPLERDFPGSFIYRNRETKSRSRK